MKRIVCVISSLVANGAERVMSLIINRAINEGIEVLLILVSSKKIDYEIDEKIGIDFLCDKVNGKGLQAVYKRWKNLRSEIADYRPDAVLSFMTTCNIYSILSTIGLDIPVIISERNDPIRDCKGVRKRFARDLSYSFARGYIFQTDEAKKCFSQKIQKQAIVIPNPVKQKLPLAVRNGAEKKIVAAGRLTPQKNYPMMLEAFALFHKSYPDFTLSIYGEGEEKEKLVDLVNNLSLQDCVFFEGLVKDLHERTKTAYMFVMSSDYEGISNSLIEAMAMGLPCISTDCPCGGARFLIQDGISGILTPVGDVKALADAMCDMAESKDKADILGTNALRVRELLSEDKIIGQYFDYMRKIIEKG